jgi:large conductance mechanosensitive channel
MRKDFRDFILKGNLLHLAVAFILGAAFGTVVKSFINDLIMPIIGKLVGGVDFTNLYINLSDQVYESATAAREAGAAAIYYGSFINTLITFVIIALVMFWLIRVAARMDKPVEAAASTTKDCPFCMSTIAITATRCPHCTSELGSG